LKDKILLKSSVKLNVKKHQERKEKAERDSLRRPLMIEKPENP